MTIHFKKRFLFYLERRTRAGLMGLENLNVVLRWKSANSCFLLQYRQVVILGGKTCPFFLERPSAFCCLHSNISGPEGRGNANDT